MKKLMVMLAVAAFAVAAQAVQYTWGIANPAIKPGGEMSEAGLLQGGTAFLFIGAVTATDEAFDLTNAKFVTSAGQNGDLTFGFSGSKNVKDDPSGYITATSGQAYSIVLLDQTGVTSLDNYEGNYVILNGTSSQGSIPGATTTYYAKLNNSTQVLGDSWSTMSVPEPTSAMLLLLGMAGLALRRRQA